MIRFVLFFVLSVAACAEDFKELLADEWQWTMEQSPTWASQLGDRRWNDRWPDVSLARQAEQQEHRLALVARLKAIERSSLPAEQRLNYDLFRYEAELAVEEYQMKMHLAALTHRDGIHLADEIASALRFEGRKDFEDWIARLRSFPTYMDQTLEVLRAGAKAGRVWPKVVMKRVPPQIERQIVEDAEKSPFFAPFKTWPESIPAAERAELVAKAKAAIAESVVPSYRKMLAFFKDEHLPACPDVVGASALPDGDALYALAARKFTTTRMTPEEIHALGLREVERILKAMDAIIAQVGFKGTRAEFFEHLRSDPKFYYKTPGELLDGYRAVSKRVDPLLVKLFKTLPRMPYGVEPIPDKAAPHTTAAYYRQPSGDGTRAGSFFVNLYRPQMRPKYEMMALTLHEAVPGHHLQIALAYEQQSLPEFRRFGGEAAYNAYIEGWALYAESLGDELGLYDDPYSKFGQLIYEIWRACRLVVDTGLHVKKWTREQAIDYLLNNSAKTVLDVENEIDRYIAWPGQALGYKIGELKIKELRALWSGKLGVKFDVREFHEVILQSGPVPLEVLERNVNEWAATR
jgi:prolyl oligopeptidase